MGMKKLANRYILTNLKEGLISKEIASGLLKGFNFDDKVLQDDGSLDIEYIEILMDDVYNNCSDKNVVELKNYTSIKDYLINISKMFDYYGKHYLTVINNEEIIYRKRIFCEWVASNSYILISGNEAILIDCGVEADEISKCLDNFGITLKYILLTHAHRDHVFSAAEVKSATGAKIVLADKESNTIEKVSNNRITINDVDIFVKDNEVISFNNLSIKIIETPGHTEGSICYEIGNGIFTGDTLFKSAVGISNDDKSYDEIVESIKKRIITLSDNKIIYAGHGENSSIKEEKVSNPYLK